MSEKTRRELSLLVDSFDEEDPTPEEIAAATAALPVSVKAWAADVRQRFADFEEQERQARFAAARAGHEAASRALANRPPETVRPLNEGQLVMRALIQRAPAEVRAGFLKFEEATAEDLADMIGVLRYLLGEDDA